MDIVHILVVAFATTVAWFAVGGVVYMNPFVARIYRKYHTHPSMKHFATQSQYLSGVFVIAGFVPILLTTVAYEMLLAPMYWVSLGILLAAVRIVPRLCDMWMQTSYPNVLLLIELINGMILSFVIAYMLTVL
jgi:hypothetical protein